jgi:hypothetical protein
MIEDNELRDFFAAFAMQTLLQKYETNDKPYLIMEVAECSYEMADEMMLARKYEEPVEAGLAAVKTRRKKNEE